jgi:hypothetical protein
VGASGKLVLLYGCGSIAGPLLVGLAMQRVGPPGFLLYLMAVYGGLGLFAVYRMARRAAPLQAEGTMPLMCPATTPVGATAIAAELAPSPHERSDANGEPNVKAYPPQSPA